MSRHVAGDATAAQQAAEATRGNTPIPAGNYLARILPKKGTTFIEERPAAKQGANASKTVLNVRLEILPDQPSGKRQVFKEVPLFQRWAPNGRPDSKYPDGAPAFDYFDFFGKALGHPVGNPAGDTLPDDNQIIGQVVGVRVSYRKNPKSPNGEDQQVSFYPASEHVATPEAASAASVAGAPAWTPPVQVAQAAQAPAWNPPAQAQQNPPAASQPWGVTPQQAAEVAVPAPQGAQGPWAQQAAIAGAGTI